MINNLLLEYMELMKKVKLLKRKLLHYGILHLKHLVNLD